MLANKELCKDSPVLDPGGTVENSILKLVRGGRLLILSLLLYTFQGLSGLNTVSSAGLNEEGQLRRAAAVLL